MTGDQTGLLVGLAVTVLPVAVTAVWGERRRRRLEREYRESFVIVLRFDTYPMMRALQQFATQAVDAAKQMSEAFGRIDAALGIDVDELEQQFKALERSE